MTGMGLLLAFAAGWLVGARAGPQHQAELLGAWRALRETEEFAALGAAVRAHLAGALRGLADTIEGTSGLDDGDDLVERVRSLFERR
jgi:hypothetical protein